MPVSIGDRPGLDRLKSSLGGMQIKLNDSAGRLSSRGDTQPLLFTA